MRERLRHYRRHVGYAAILAVAIALFGADPVSGQPFAAQIQALLRRSNTWLGTQTFTNVTVTGTCTGCGGVTYPLLAPDGTVAAPSYSFTNETGLGLWRSSAGQIRFTQASTDRLGFDSTGLLIPSSESVRWGSAAMTGVDTQLTRAAVGIVGITAGVTLGATAFASLPASTNGTILYCNDCQETTPSTCPTTQASCVCATGGTGAIARRINGVWYCTF